MLSECFPGVSQVMDIWVGAPLIMVEVVENSQHNCS